MSNFSRFLMLLAAMFMSLLFFFPMWKIFLKAPQYPEGLEMHIWINKISGNTEFSLQNFNILNHYIGMEPIHPDSFAELTYMPYIVFGLMAAAVLVSLLGKKVLMKGWLLVLVLASTAGLADFYLWLNRFGTNLDPTAPIKVPGMTYIPPFLGTKQLLNFEALSLPAAGSLGILIPMLLASVAILVEYKRKQKLKIQTT